MEALQPKLRFPEFKGNWSNYTLEMLTDKIGDGLHGTPVYVENSDVYFINGNNLIDGKIVINENSKMVSVETLKKNDKGLNTNSILISINGTIGSVSRYNNEKIMLGKSVGYFNFKQSKDFYFHILQSNKIQDYFISELTGSTIKNLSLKTLRETNILQPSLEEQTRIANFLSSVDEKLSLLKGKKELLEDYKKGIMQKIFNQELRFTDDKGNDFENWEVKSLGELCDYKNGGSFEKYVCDDGIYNLISLNSIDINGKIKNSHKKVSVTDNSLQKGDLIMVLSDVAHGNFLGLTDIVPDDNFVLNQRMGVLKPVLNFNSFYLKTFINYNQSYFKLMGKGSSQQNLSKGDIENFIVKLPCKEEQAKIANFLSAIDEKIVLVSNQIQDTLEYKRGLLQQMFV